MILIIMGFISVSVRRIQSGGKSLNTRVHIMLYYIICMLCIDIFTHQCCIYFYLHVEINEIPFLMLKATVEWRLAQDC